jgi:hypothetical protein
MFQSSDDNPWQFYGYGFDRGKTEEISSTIENEFPENGHKNEGDSQENTICTTNDENIKNSELDESGLEPVRTCLV